jgi:hypothetical protein
MIRNENSDEDAVFWLNVTNTGKVSIGPYTNAFMES